MLGPGAIVWDCAIPTLTGWTGPASRLACLHSSSKIRPVLIKVPKPAPRHCTWDGRKPCPTDARGHAHAHATPRYAAILQPYPALPCHPNQCPSIPTISWPVWIAEACDDIHRRPGLTSPTALTLVPGYLPTYILTCCVVGGGQHLHLSLPPRRCPSLTRQVRFPC